MVLHSAFVKLIFVLWISPAHPETTIIPDNADPDAKLAVANRAAVLDLSDPRSTALTLPTRSCSCTILVRALPSTLGMSIVQVLPLKRFTKAYLGRASRSAASRCFLSLPSTTRACAWDYLRFLTASPARPLSIAQPEQRRRFRQGQRSGARGSHRKSPATSILGGTQTTLHGFGKQSSPTANWGGRFETTRMAARRGAQRAGSRRTSFEAAVGRAHAAGGLTARAHLAPINLTRLWPTRASSGVAVLPTGQPAACGERWPLAARTASSAQKVKMVGSTTAVLPCGNAGGSAASGTRVERAEQQAFAWAVGMEE